MFFMIRSRLLLVAQMFAPVSVIAVPIVFMLSRAMRVDEVGTSVSILAECGLNVR